MKACMYFCCSLYMKCNKLLATLRIIIQLIHYFYACQLSVWYHTLGALSPPQKRGNAEIKLDYSIREREAGIGATKDKKILPENQRVTTVTLTEKGEKILEDIKRMQADVFSTISVSLGLAPDQAEYFQDILKNAIGFFDETMGLKLNDN